MTISLQSFLSALAVASVFLVACGSDADLTIRVADYDQQCSEDDECILAIDGDVCPGCPNAAVAARDPRYATDRRRLADQCPNAATEGAPQCEPLRATCSAGSCTAAR
jgi:hypothetical protein